MLQAVNTAEHASWPNSIVDPIVSRPKTWQRSSRHRRTADLQSPSVNDVALLYPEAVVASSDPFAWQDIRVIHLRHNIRKMVLPSAESHCLVLKLSTPLHLRTSRGRISRVRAGGQVAIIPAGTRGPASLIVRTYAILCSCI